ncbi:UdgX family uracil-DNA binding protein [Consotaella salsifontis]|uniref:Type-4 uracil-DNA glycosylase n=1 Tax=Consotaella salsifontis TaxID=1365950 RepID=A0A1T4PXB0_9HYPH|nr:UdgX family uracil-DNA binding protein [Consotaella salsifontis]SJZ96135.1 DNA polymerase [Consotaella salsifontis]
MKFVRLSSPTDFEGWRQGARMALALGVDPADIEFTVGESAASLFAEPLPPAPDVGGRFTVPRAFIDLAEVLVSHRDPARFSLAYRLLFRLQAEPKLLAVASDRDVALAEAMAKAVSRDSHKMKAFVRFREVETEEGRRSIAWFEPEHHIVERVAPFFVRRFTGMSWSLLTPLLSAHWNGERLEYGPGATAEMRPRGDDMEALWLTYYASIFNPSRLKMKAMRAQMPKKYWKNMPEAALIAPLAQGAEAAREAMIATPATLPSYRHERQRERFEMARAEAPVFDPDHRPESLEEAREAARHCRACPLWEPATQTVFGEGPKAAPVMFVGEQPGDQEDLAGEPFIGPAGQVFDAALAAAGIDRAQTYVTNAVKHFKFVPRGKRRIHQKPSGGEIAACRGWLDLERSFVAPKLVVAMGATAASSVLGRTVTIRSVRSQLIDLPAGGQALVTVHPSYLLRLPDPDAKAREEALFREDMARVRQAVPEIALAA